MQTQAPLLIFANVVFSVVIQGWQFSLIGFVIRFGKFPLNCVVVVVIAFQIFLLLATKEYWSHAFLVIVNAVLARTVKWVLFVILWVHAFGDVLSEYVNVQEDFVKPSYLVNDSLINFLKCQKMGSLRNFYK